MNRQKRIAILTGVLAAFVCTGCSMQYNGAWGFNKKKTNEQVLTEASAYHQNKQAHDAAAGNPAPTAPSAMRGSDDGQLNSLGPVDSVRPVHSAAGKSADARRAGVDFAAPTDPARPETEPTQVSADDPPAPRSFAPLGVYGDLPGRKPNQHSPLDGPDNIEQVTFATEGADFDPEVDPTSRWIVYASTRHREEPDIYIQKVGGTTATQLTNDPGKDIMPTFSPDAKRIAFASNRSGNWDIYLMDAEGGQATQITNSPSHDLHPSFSPDGKQLVYCSYSDKSGQWELIVIDLANPASRRIIGNGLFPNWSPKGDRIVFQRARERGTRWFSVWTIDLVNGESRRATEIIAANNAAAITPSWSPDGEYLVFSTVMNPDTTSAQRPTTADIWIVGIDGRGRAALTHNLFANLQPVWAANGAIYFVSTSGKGGVENVWSLRPDQALKLAPNPTNTVAAPKTGEPTASVPTDP